MLYHEAILSMHSSQFETRRPETRDDDATVTVTLEFAFLSVPSKFHWPSLHDAFKTSQHPSLSSETNVFYAATAPQASESGYMRQITYRQQVGSKRR